MELGENRTNKMQVQEAEQLSKRAAQTCITDYAEDWHKQRSQKFETLLVKFIADANLSEISLNINLSSALERFNDEFIAFCHNVHLIFKSALERCVRADELVKKATEIVVFFPKK
ncbi:hypothetical protein QR680_019415 [Steinernema hermaphroditum]|uniref:Uncharacterized protein n=1 Tax=Steinernema hermaphroditum TaxID=289476 RepID=A0AA39LAS1_9BILA|nr:hypothetical protein QR680_019415 [Steinernema hermaphroditum]